MPHEKELRYKIADAINDAVKRIPGFHRVAKTAFIELDKLRAKTSANLFRRPLPKAVKRTLPVLAPCTAPFAACTILAKNYLSMARVLAESFHKFHPDAPFFVLLLDPAEGYFDPARENFLVMEPAHLDIPDARSFFFKYNLLEVSTGVKPYLLAHLFEQHDIEKLVYFDPDILILRKLDPIVRWLDQNSTLLVPHITTPYTDNAWPGELDLLRSGTFNLGFIGLRRNVTTKQMLCWWQDRVYHYGRSAVQAGMFVDQKWMDLAPGLFEGVKIIREPGFDVAYWNLHERLVSIKDGEYVVNDQPCYFFHFSGFEPDRPGGVSKHQNRFTLDQLGETRKVFEQYRELLYKHGWEQSRSWPYTYDYYESGERIPRGAREEFWELGEDASVSDDAPAASPTVATNLAPGINVAGYVTSEKGVGEGMRAHLRSIAAAGIPHVVNNFVDSGSQNVRSGYQIETDNPHIANLVCVNADQVPYFERKKRGYFSRHFNIGCWAWELSSFPEEWRSSFHYFHELWAPSTFVQQALLNASSVPVICMPYSVDPGVRLTGSWDRSKFGMAEGEFVFLFMFDFFSFMERKNPVGLVRAFQSAFGADKRVKLFIKVSHSDFAAADFEQLKQSCQAPNIQLYDAVLPREGINALMALSDCYVSLHRSEGFGLTLSESMSLGKPVIATAYSGNMDFMHDDNSFLVKYELAQLEKSHGPYKKGLVWADPDLDHAAELMRYVYENREAAMAIGKKAQEDIQRQLHPLAVGRAMQERLDVVVQNAASLSSSGQKPVEGKAVAQYVQNLQRNWDRFGKTDPYYWILSDPGKKGNQWDREEFYETGRKEIEELLRELRKTADDLNWARALDFGCGVGRLTQALAPHFKECHGVDISQSMIELARRQNRFDNCTYHLNTALNLRLFPDDHFDLVYSNIVLQHIHPSCSKRYLPEFIRVLRPGGMAVFQLPSEPLDPSWRRQHEAVAKRSEPQPARNIEMYGIHRDEVIAILEHSGATVERVEPNQNAGREWIGFRYFVRKPKSVDAETSSGKTTAVSSRV